jgi:transposase
MTGPRCGSAPAGTRPWTRTRPQAPSALRRTPNPSTAGSSSAPNSVHRAASASRPSGRFAGGLRPRLDPAALTRRAPNQPRKNQKQESDQENSLTAPRSFRDDLSDTSWARIARQVVPTHPKGGRPCPPERWREYLNAMLYVARTGCPWRSLPHDFTVTWSARPTSTSSGSPVPACGGACCASCARKPAAPRVAAASRLGRWSTHPP